MHCWVSTEVPKPERVDVVKVRLFFQVIFMLNIRRKLAILTDTVLSSGHVGRLADNFIDCIQPAGEVISAVTSRRTG